MCEHLSSRVEFSVINSLCKRLVHFFSVIFTFFCSCHKRCLVSSAIIYSSFFSLSVQFDDSSSSFHYGHLTHKYRIEEKKKCTLANAFKRLQSCDNHIAISVRFINYLLCVSMQSESTPPPPELVSINRVCCCYRSIGNSQNSHTFKEKEKKHDVQQCRCCRTAIEKVNVCD